MEVDLQECDRSSTWRAHALYGQVWGPRRGWYPMVDKGRQQEQQVAAELSRGVGGDPRGVHSFTKRAVMASLGFSFHMLQRGGCKTPCCSRKNLEILCPKQLGWLNLHTRYS